MSKERLLRQQRRQLEQQHRQLAKEHLGLKEQVKLMQGRRHLSSGERAEVQTLQRMKLQRKDALQNLQSELAQLDRELQQMTASEDSDGPSKPESR